MWWPVSAFEKHETSPWPLYRLDSLLSRGSSLQFLAALCLTSSRHLQHLHCLWKGLRHKTHLPEFLHALQVSCFLEAIDNFIEIERNGAEQKTSTEKVKNRTKSLRCLVSCRCPGALAPLYRPVKQRLKMFLWTRHQSQCREHSPSLSISFHLLPLYTSRHCVCRIEKDVH